MSKSITLIKLFKFSELSYVAQCRAAFDYVKDTNANDLCDDDFKKECTFNFAYNTMMENDDVQDFTFDGELVDLCSEVYEDTKEKTYKVMLVEKCIHEYIVNARSESEAIIKAGIGDYKSYNGLMNNIDTFYSESDAEVLKV